MLLLMLETFYWEQSWRKLTRGAGLKLTSRDCEACYLWPNPSSGP